MKVPLLDIRPQLEQCGDALRDAVLEVVASTRYIGGPKVEQLEEAIARYSGAEHAVGVSSGTDALLISLMALGAGQGDIVLTTPYSFFATAGCIVRTGATPALVDIVDESYTMDPEALRAWFGEHPGEAGRVKAVIPVHLYGQCADMDALVDIAREYGAAVIEDAAQAIGAGYPSRGGEKRAGAIGDAGCLSFFPSKNLGGLGDGGMVVTNDAGLADKVAVLRNHGAQPKYHHKWVGGNFRLDAVQAAALLVKLDHLDEWHAARRENAAFYDQHLDVAGLKTPSPVYGRARHTYNQYVVAVPERRDALREHLTSAGVANEVYYPVPFHEQECFQGLGYRRGMFPKSEWAAAHTLALPVYPGMTGEMREYVVDQVNRFYA